ncbi:hypothetical protein [Mycobacteroides abscessus]|uniref:hypothetical protein n=1 Tax=Mycobacteroides abscessus TaxID=36809 RepID=UPI000377AC89|nr:hypothetical protein [Mycobacteroides abscessus]
MTNLSKEFIAPTESVLRAVAEEREAQDAKWGEQNHPDAIYDAGYWIGPARIYRNITNDRAARGFVTYADILLEEVAEAVEEALSGDKNALIDELIQVAAVAVAWVEKIDRGH